MTEWGVFAYSRFGYGQSDPAPRPWPMTYMHREALEVLPRVLDAAGIERAVLVGHSDGGSIAAIHAGGTRDPRLRGVVTLAAHFFVEPMNIAAIERIAATYATGAAGAAGATGATGATGAAGDLRARLGRYHRDVDNAFHGWSGAWLDRRFRDFDICSYLPRIAVPMLALQGEDDPYGTEAQLRAVHDHARVAVETRVIPGARHAPHLEATMPTLSAIVAFVLDRAQEIRA